MKKINYLINFKIKGKNKTKKNLHIGQDLIRKYMVGLTGHGQLKTFKFYKCFDDPYEAKTKINNQTFYLKM